MENISQQRISSESKMGLLNYVNLFFPELDCERSIKTSSTDLLSPTNQASIGLQAAEVDEFAVDDYDSDDSDSGESCMQWQLFQRTAFRPRDKERQSLITLMIESARKQKNISGKRFVEVLGLNFQHTKDEFDRGNDWTALSPKMTRHSMLATELTDSLRRGLVLERKQGKLMIDAVLKYRHE